MAEALRRIKAVVAKPGYRLLVSWDRGAASNVDLSDMISRGGVFVPLADKDAFAAVRIGENSRVVEWPMPQDDDGYPIIEIDADALYAKSRQQETASMAGTMRALLDTLKQVRRVAGGPIKDLG